MSAYIGMSANAPETQPSAQENRARTNILPLASLVVCSNITIHFMTDIVAAILCQVRRSRCSQKDSGDLDNTAMISSVKVDRLERKVYPNPHTCTGIGAKRGGSNFRIRTECVRVERSEAHRHQLSQALTEKASL